MIHLRTLGGVDLRDAGGREIHGLLAQPKRVALLVYLAMAGASGFRRRDKIIALFWPELDDEHARGSLRQALSFLRRTLGDGVIITRGEDEISVDRTTLECDALVLADPETPDEDALKLCHGDFLDGFFVSDVAPDLQSWIEEERATCRRRAAARGWAVAEEQRKAGNDRESSALARRAASLTPDDEAEVRRLVVWLDQLGDRAGAIAAYEEFAARLAREYDAHPAPETQALVGRVRSRTRPVVVGPAPLSYPEPAGPLKSSLPDAGPAAARQRMSVATWALGVGAIVLLVNGAVVVRKAFAPEEERTSRHLTLAVLPLRELSPDSSTQYIADGLTDQLITDLAQGSGIQVISSRTMFSYRDSALDADAVARRLNATAVVSGTVQYVGDTVHLTVQLSRAGETAAIVARSASGSRGEVLRLERDLARTILRQIAGQASDGDATASGTPTLVSNEAADLYMRGRYYWGKRGGPNLFRSIRLFTQALDVDPGFAEAYSGMADAYVQLGYASLLAPDDAFPKAEAAARDALELDSTLAEPYATLGFVNLYYKWNWEGAESSFHRSLALNPSYATAHEWYGFYLAAMGRFAEAIESEHRAAELDPLSAPIAGTKAWILYYAGRLSEARRQIDIALRMDSTYALGYLYLGRILQEQADLDGALTAFAGTGPLRGWIPTVAGQGYVLAQLGSRAQAKAVLASMDSLSGSQYVTAYAVALVHAALGQTDSAFAWLERARGERTHWLVWLNRDPRWKPLRSDPKFSELTRSIGLPP